jgi:hypothetical protein
MTKQDVLDNAVFAFADAAEDLAPGRAWQARSWIVEPPLADQPGRIQAMKESMDEEFVAKQCGRPLGRVERNILRDMRHAIEDGLALLETYNLSQVVLARVRDIGRTRNLDICTFAETIAARFMRRHARIVSRA